MSSPHRSGFVGLAGRPNVGKSSLLNALVGEPFWPVSAKPQTTRERQLAILTTESAQLIFVDTPGLHQPQHQLGEYLNQTASAVLGDSDVILAVFDLHLRPGEADRLVAERLNAADAIPLLGALNKIDLVEPGELQAHWDAYRELCPQVEFIGVSATRGDNLDQLLEALIARLPEGPQYYPPEEVTDRYERDIAADLVRAAAMELLRDELPHSIAIRIDEYRERNQGGAYIAATVFVERATQKAIVIGRGGSMLREIGTRARQRIEQMSGRKVYLELRVKELPGWRNDPAALQRLGYAVPEGED